MASWDPDQHLPLGPVNIWDHAVHPSGPSSNPDGITQGPYPAHGDLVHREALT